MPDLVYNESMSLACQWGKCQDCPEAGEPIDSCSCTCHIPDVPQPTMDGAPIHGVPGVRGHWVSRPTGDEYAELQYENDFAADIEDGDDEADALAQAFYERWCS